jgi:hypothetical protein
LADPRLLVNSRLFTDQECGFSFRYPWGWEVNPTNPEWASGAPCLFGARPSDWSLQAEEKGVCFDEYAIYIAVSDLTPQQAAAENPLFIPLYYDDGRWFAYDSILEEFEVPVVTTPNLVIIRQGITARTYTDCLLGGYAGIGFTQVLIVSDGTAHSAAIDSRPFAPSKALEVIVTSLLFHTLPE